MQEPYMFQVMGLRPGCGWISVISLPSKAPSRVRRLLRANGMEWMLSKREWRVVENPQA